MFKYRDAATHKFNLTKGFKKPWVGFVVLGIVLVLLMYLSSARIIQFSFGNKLAEVITYCIIAIGFSYLLGYAGLSSLGTAGLVGIGAYVCAFFTKKGVQTGVLSGPWPLLVIFIIAIVIALIIGLIIGFASLRIEGLFLAIVTLGLSEVLYQVFVNANAITDGVNGISIKLVSILGDFELSKLGVNIMVVLFLVFMLIITYNVQRSVTGRAMLAMKNSTSAAQAMGISLLKYRLMAFMLSTVYCAIAGVLTMAAVQYTDPKKWSLLFSLNILAACIFGGSRSLWGIMFGAFIVFGVEPLFLTNIPALRDNSWILSVIIGAILILLVLFYRGGVIQLINDIKSLFKKAIEKRRVKKYGYEE